MYISKKRKNNKNRSSRIFRISSNRNQKFNLFGGTSYAGIRPKELPLTTIEMFANYWNNIMKRNVWYSDGQKGYYFSNLNHYYMSQTHTHIYKIDDIAEEKIPGVGLKQVWYTTKIKNVHVEKEANVVLDYKQIASWLTKKNVEIGANTEKDPW